jgi:hypothetical protein
MDCVGDQSSFDDLHHLHPGPHTILSGSNLPNIPNAIPVVSPGWGFGPEPDIPPVMNRSDFQRDIGMPVRKVKPGGPANQSLRAMADLDGPPSISTSYIAWQSLVRRLC